MIHAEGVATFAAASHLAVEDELGGQGHVGPGSFPLDVDAVRKRADGGHCPTAATVDWDVLVPAEGHVVDSFHIAPIPLFGQVFAGNALVRQRTDNALKLFVLEGQPIATVFGFFLFQFGLRGFFRWNGGVALIVGPGVSGYSPRTVAFDTQVVDSSDDSEVSILPPVCSPRISNNPKFCSIFLSPTSYTDIMFISLPSTVINQYSRFVLVQSRGISNLTDDRPSVINFVHHRNFSALCLSDDPIFINAIDFSSALSSASRA